MNKFEKKLANHFLNEAYLGEDQDEKMPVEERKSFLEAVANIHKLGEMIHSNAKLQEVTETLKSVMERAEKVTMAESEHWFDNVNVSRHMKQMNEAMKIDKETKNVLTNETIVNDWKTLYQTSNDPKKNERALKAISKDYKVPDEAKNSIEKIESKLYE